MAGKHVQMMKTVTCTRNEKHLETQTGVLLLEQSYLSDIPLNRKKQI
jgi:hypothetical protein